MSVLGWSDSPEATVVVEYILLMVDLTHLSRHLVFPWSFLVAVARWFFKVLEDIWLCGGSGLRLQLKGAGVI